MAKYLLLYSGGGMPEGDAAMKATMDAWAAWMGQLGSKLVDGGNPFTPMVKNITSDGRVGDGPAGSMASGYSIIEAGSMDEAVGIAKSCPVLMGGAKISVFETFQVPGM